MKRSFRARRILFFVPLAILAIAVFGGIVMFLWNNVLAVVLNISTISFVQALGILVLSKILFSGFGRGYYRGNPYWRHRLQNKWAAMTPEEKEKFRQELKERCGSWGYKSWSTETSPGQKTSEP